MNAWARVVPPALCLMVAGLTALSAQPLFQGRIDLVQLTVTVAGRDGQPVVGLSEDDFEVLEEGRPQTLDVFAAEPAPLDVALLIDSSSSMRYKMPLVGAAARRFVDTLRADDRASIVGFTSLVRVHAGFTGDARALGTAIDELTPRGHTSLYDALYVMLNAFPVDPGSEQMRRRTLVVLTDGDDTSSVNTYDAVLEAVRRGGVCLYTVSLPDQEGRDPGPGAGRERRPILTAADFELRRLASETGGRALRARYFREVRDLYDSIVADLSQQYTLGYISTDDRTDGRFRRVTVRIPSRPEVTVRTKTGYYAPGTRPSG